MPNVITTGPWHIRQKRIASSWTVSHIGHNSESILSQNDSPLDCSHLRRFSSSYFHAETVPSTDLCDCLDNISGKYCRFDFIKLHLIRNFSILTLLDALNTQRHWRLDHALIAIKWMARITYRLIHVFIPRCYIFSEHTALAISMFNRTRYCIYNNNSL